MSLVYGSVCSGIEAASAEVCGKCGAPRTDDKLKRDRLRKHGRADWCSRCYSRHATAVRNARVSSCNKRDWNLRSRYGISQKDVDAMISSQGGKCAICAADLKKYHVDHCHDTGLVRGVLCSFCNRSLPLIEDDVKHAAALRYLWGAA